MGAPDAYAGELPVVFATLVPGQRASEAELLAFTAERVDEAPAKPKSVTVIEHMPMTNVGKIYKSELRAMAAGQVAAALVEAVCAELGVAPEARPRVLSDEQRGVVVQLDAQAPPQVRARLQSALAPLPVKTQVLAA